MTARVCFCGQTSKLPLLLGMRLIFSKDVGMFCAQTDVCTLLRWYNKIIQVIK